MRTTSPQADPVPGAHLLTPEGSLYTLSSSQCPVPAFPYHPAYLALPVGSELPLGWGSSYTSYPQTPSAPSQPSPDSRCHAEPRSLPPWPLSAGHLLGAKPSFPSFPESGSFFVPFVFALTTFVISRAVWDIGDVGHCPLSSQFCSHPGQAAVPSGAHPWGAGPVMAVNVPPASEGPRWD